VLTYTQNNHTLDETLNCTAMKKLIIIILIIASLRSVSAQETILDGKYKYTQNKKESENDSAVCYLTNTKELSILTNWYKTRIPLDTLKDFYINYTILDTTFTIVARIAPSQDNMEVYLIDDADNPVHVVLNTAIKNKKRIWWIKYKKMYPNDESIYLNIFSKVTKRIEENPKM
jgi:hypothetical protein